MKKFIRLLLVGAILLTCIIVFLNIQVTTQKGINYEWHSIKMPLYLKALNFLDRHYNYGQLAKRIIKDAKDDDERALKLFAWTHQNIKKQPETLPVIDDHVWHIIVRGYGVGDQLSDVFTTLCNYAGVDAFFTFVGSTEDGSKVIPLSFVEIKGSWTVFDPYRGVYFKDNEGNFADIATIRSGNYTIVNIGKKADFKYKLYLPNLPSIKEAGLKRANIQSPLNRLLFAIKNRTQ